MSRNRLSLRLIGELPPTEELNQLLGIRPVSAHRRGERGLLDEVMSMDVWVINLVPRKDWPDGRPPVPVISHVTRLLGRITPALNALDRSQVHAELYLSTRREEAMGGFEIPAEWIAAAAAANLELDISVLATLGRDEEDEPDQAGDDE